jgi:hypothetical protein
MEREKFYKIIDNLASDWYIDVNQPFAVHSKKIQRPQENQLNWLDETQELNTSTGEVQVISWAKKETFCEYCCKFVKQSKQTINLLKNTVKCRCGVKIVNGS